LRFQWQCSFVEYRGYKVIYRRYASLFFIVGVKDDDSEVRRAAFHSMRTRPCKVCVLTVSCPRHCCLW
jgi:hypothetical protein